ncbi:MAG: adenosylmethionine decarboxylase [Rubrivivax sp.]|nr:MAG: adenosylmethionine decarboxylase [Rubrivivax sp.]
MKGVHFTADLRGCPADNPLMTQVSALQALCTAAVAGAGLRAVGQCFHAFPPADVHTEGGVTGVVLLAESHLAVHTWPESGVVTLDVFVCNKTADNTMAARRLLDDLSQKFWPEQCAIQEVPRVNW